MPRPYDGLCLYCQTMPKRAGQTYCSRMCRSAATWTERVCERCNCLFLARKVYVARGQMKYCSVTCTNQSFRVRPVQFFDGEPYYRNARGHFWSHKLHRFIHRAVWESVNGPIPDGHIVHHIDHDKTNNNVDNLTLMRPGDHTSYHNSANGIPMGIVICIACGINVTRRASAIRRGQNKFCTRSCANSQRGRDANGTYA